MLLLWAGIGFGVYAGCKFLNFGSLLFLLFDGLGLWSFSWLV